jgi:hypothetical protein
MILKYTENSQFIYPSGKSMTPHLPRYQDLAVARYSCGSEALDMAHPRLSLN